MSPTQQGLAIAALVTLAGIGADSMLKAASQDQHVLTSRWFAAGMVLTVAFALGWVVLMRFMKLAVAGAIYAVVSAVLLAIIGVVLFDERLTPSEMTGIGMAVAAVALLSRFSA